MDIGSKWRTPAPTGRKAPQLDVPTTIEGKLARIICDIEGFDEGLMVNDTNLRAEVGMDSLDFVELSLCISEEFALVVPDDYDFERLVTFGDVVRLVFSLQSAPGATAMGGVGADDAPAGL